MNTTLSGIRVYEVNRKSKLDKLKKLLTYAQLSQWFSLRMIIIGYGMGGYLFYLSNNCNNKSMDKMEQSNSRVSNGLDASHSQQLATSIVAEMEDPKNSRVLNRKQI